MIYSSEQMEKAAVLDVAQLMCAAARTAPKTKGVDKIVTLVITDAEKDALADKMEELDEMLNGPARSFISRDAGCLRKSQALVLIGYKKNYFGLNCGYCGFTSCDECAGHDSACIFNSVDLGIAIGSAVSVAADNRIDSRVMFSVGRCAAEMNYFDKDTVLIGIPLSVSGKSPFFDRK